MSALHHVLVPPVDDDTPSRPVCLVLHGILGSGANWMTFAKRLVGRRPDWQFVLVDLRAHGRSQDLAPPDTLEQCARDLEELELELPGAVRAVAGHSFGSKVATAFAAHRTSLGRPLEELWLLDGDPSAHKPKPSSLRGDDVDRVLAALRTLPDEFVDRDAFIGGLVEAGLSRPVAAWLGTNLRRRPEPDGPFRFRLDLDRIEALLADYRATDGWPWLEAEESRRFLVVGGKSPVVGPEARERFDRLPGELSQFVLETAGHWVHVDDLDGLLAVFERHLSRL
ncbi:MAG: alpha/beta hydrolase [Planctomycetota bacterium]